MSALLQHLQALEVELHHPGVRTSPSRLEQLLHPQFHEVGRSGRQYSRATVIRFLLQQVVQASVQSEHFHVVELVPGVALLTYRSAHRDSDGRLRNHALRSSVWVLEGGAWTMRYHQGTAAAEPW